MFYKHIYRCYYLQNIVIKKVDIDIKFKIKLKIIVKNSMYSVI